MEGSYNKVTDSFRISPLVAFQRSGVSRQRQCSVAVFHLFHGHSSEYDSVRQGETIAHRLLHHACLVMKSRIVWRSRTGRSL